MAPLSGGRASPGLRTWMVVDELVLEVYRITRRFPRGEHDALSDALRRTAVSAAARLAAGDGNGGAPEAGALRSVCSRLAELRYYLYLSRRLRLIDALAYRAVTGRHERSTKALRRLLDAALAPLGKEAVGPATSRTNG